MTTEIKKLRRSATEKDDDGSESLDDKSKEKNFKQFGRHKEFTPRNSLLTDLYQIDHIQTIYNIFLVVFIILFITLIMRDYIEKREIDFGLRTVNLSLSKLSDVIYIWLCMQISTFAVYVGFYAWSSVHVKCSKNFLLKIIVNYGFLLTFIASQILLVVLPAKFLVRVHFPPGSGFIILMEQVRMLMKNYAFVRSNTLEVLKLKTNDKSGAHVKICPEFSKFFYFMFAPTLIYKNEYPRTKYIDWRKLLWYSVEIGITIFYAAFVIEHFVMPLFEKYGLTIFKSQNVIMAILNLSMPAACIYLLGFYVLLHVSQNFMAELLGFADKLFYKDWWNSSSYSVFYKSWNIIVQDWLYHYIYRDVYGLSRSKVVSTITVFFISAAVHEYIMAFALRFFYPVMSILFGGFGLIVLFVTRNFPKMTGNMLIWFGVFIGSSIMFTLYSMEYYARLHCPPHNNKFYDLLLPRSWSCYREVEINASM